MDEDAKLIGSPITLAELKALGEFVRWQDVDARVAELVNEKRLSNGYPIVASRLPANEVIDLYVGEKWQQVKFLRTEGGPMTGDHRILYLDDGKEKSTSYKWYGVAPAGHFTEWQGPRPETVAEAQLRDDFELVRQNHVMHHQALEDVDWPYLTFKVKSYHRDATWVEHMWSSSYTVHAADPRVTIEGVTPREPWFNTTIAVSHRWLHPEHPDPDGVEYRELLTLAETLGLHDSQAFLIDYCSLPQHPRTADETAWFREHLPGFQTQFKYVTLVLNTGSDDYSTRAWCMFELILAAMSRAKRPTLLNHDALDESLREAKQLAERYVREAGLNQEGMLKAFRGGLTTTSYNTWARDPINVALYNASFQGKQTILDKFEKELAVTDPNDRPIIVDLLKRLAFGESEG